MITLSKREKTLLQILIVLVVIVIIYYLIVSPLIEMASNAENELKNNINSIEKLEKLHEEYRKVKAKKEKYKKQLSKSENITSLVEQWANSTNVASNIAYTRRSQTTLQNKYIRITTNIKFNGVAIQSFLKFIYEVENSKKLLKTSYLRIRPALKGTSKYDIDLKIDSFTLK